MPVDDPWRLDNHVILVTGASSGLGRAVAVACDRLGAKLILAGRDQERLRQTRELLSDRGHVEAVQDLSRTEEIPAWVQRVAKESGPLSGLVHSAGVFQLKPLRYLSDQDWDDVLRPNLQAAMQLAKGFRQRGVSQKGGSIVFLASVMALVGQPGTTAYAASKGALVAMTRTLALELATEGYRVNCVAPGQVRTEMVAGHQGMFTEEQLSNIEKMHPLGLGEPNDVAYAIAFLLSPASRWITGTTLVVDGGYTAH